MGAEVPRTVAWTGMRVGGLGWGARAFRPRGLPFNPKEKYAGEDGEEGRWAELSAPGPPASPGAAG